MKKNYESWPPAQQKAHASRVLTKSGIRLMNLDGNLTVGIWSDLDSQELRWALGIYGSGDAPWRYLDGPGVPERYKLRRVPGMDVFARERAAIDEEEANRKPDQERRRELTIIQKNLKSYYRWYREQPVEAAAWRKAHQDRAGLDNWLRNPDLPWQKKLEELWQAADCWQHEHPDWNTPTVAVTPHQDSHE